MCKGKRYTKTFEHTVDDSTICQKKNGHTNPPHRQGIGEFGMRPSVDSAKGHLSDGNYENPLDPGTIIVVQVGNGFIHRPQTLYTDALIRQPHGYNTHIVATLPVP